MDHEAAANSEEVRNSTFKSALGIACYFWLE
jgi:hypothetical protein